MGIVHVFVILALGRQRMEDQKFEANFSHRRTTYSRFSLFAWWKQPLWWRTYFTCSVLYEVFACLCKTGSHSLEHAIPPLQVLILSKQVHIVILTVQLLLPLMWVCGEQGCYFHFNPHRAQYVVHFWELCQW